MADIPAAQIFDASQTMWDTGLQPAGCPNCQRVFLVEAGRIGKTCPGCGQGELEPQPARLRPEPPEKILPFRLKINNLAPLLQRFTEGVWLKPDDFSPASLLSRVTPVFLPMWLVDANLLGEWKAEAGFNYQVQSSKESYSDSGWHSRPVVETRVRWEPRLGQVTRHYDNLAVPALHEHKSLLQKTGQYPLEQAVSYQPAILRPEPTAPEALIRVPDQPPESAWPLAKDAFDRIAGEDCSRASGAQHIRNVGLRLGYQSLNWTQLLLPLYVTWYTPDDGRPRMVYINGHTGTISGPRMASQRKGNRLAGISAAIAAGIFILALLCFALVALFPPAALVGAFLAFVAFATGVWAIVPAIWPWRWNSQWKE